MTRVPELRFAGFDGEWEDSIFGDEVIRKSSNSDDKNLARVEYEDIISDLGILNKRLNSKNSAKRGILFGENDVLYGKLRPYLKNYLNPYFKGIAVGDFWVLNFLEGDSNFLFYHIQTNRFQSIANTSIGTKMPRADWNLVSDSIFSFPIKIEQEKIGDLFSKIDQLIENQEKLLDQSIAFKKSMLQKMFPKKDSLVPEFRFDGFYNNWDLKKLDKVLSIPQKQPIEIKDYKNIISVKLHNKGVVENQNSNLSFGATQYYIRKANQIIYGKQNIFNGALGIIPYSMDGKASSADIPALNVVGDNVEFVYRYVSRPTFYKRTENISSGTGSKRVHEKDLLDLSIKIPSLEEQEKIGNFFKKLDEKIAREEKLLDAYKDMKKSLLQKMFV